MNPYWWVTPAVTGLIVAFGWAINYGQLKQANQDMREKIAEHKTELTADIDKQEKRLDDHKKEVWPRITEVEKDVYRIKGKLGINGGKT